MMQTEQASATKRRKALICGIGGQDGTYLADFLLSKNYAVTGTSRDAQMLNRSGLQHLRLTDRVDVISMSGNDFRSVLQAVTRSQPDEIYNLAGQSSVGLSFDQPVEAIESISIGTLNILEAIRFSGRDIRLYNASSSECFGDTGRLTANESTPFVPRSPYAVAKTCSHNLVANYREAYQLFACNGILFNHESPLRPERFVTQKIARAAARIAAGSSEVLTLGNLDICRDWGWAPDYVQAMWLMLQNSRPEDFVIATGKTVSLQHFVQRTFEYFGLDWTANVTVDPNLFRPSDLAYSAADPTLAERRLGWRATHTIEDVIAKMCAAAAL